MNTLTVLATGPLALLQDHGRPGLGGQGVGRSGAADRGSHDLANRLVGNAPDAASIEIVFGGLSVRADHDLIVALTGAPAPATLDGTPVGHNAVLRMRAGSVLALATPRTGLRSYLAVRGGIAVAPVLGSRATDVLSGLGPPALTAGTVLPIAVPARALPILDQAAVWSPPAGAIVLRARRGPRASRVADDPFGRAWTASSRSDRIGIRLEGEPMRFVPDLPELPSEGVVRGALQVPPSGEPVLFLSDHPVTGGYPVIAVVISTDVDLAAQARPGQQIVFRDKS
ncbi:MAG: biotin-dependent carboxyltransferase family protein [Actinomycetota bacterium]|nr:biotin-dependent carboxyltransferase family protein [Actinomycetota bacterium]